MNRAPAVKREGRELVPPESGGKWGMELLSLLFLSHLTLAPVPCLAVARLS